MELLFDLEPFPAIVNVLNLIYHLIQLFLARSQLSDVIRSKSHDQLVIFIAEHPFFGCWGFWLLNVLNFTGPLIIFSRNAMLNNITLP